MEYIYFEQLYNVVIDILKAKTELTSNKLYKEVTKVFQDNKIATVDRKGKGRRVKNPTNFQLSKPYFSDILKILENDGYINKRIDEKSKRHIQTVYYSLTEKALMTLQLQVLQKSDNQRLFKKIYKKIIFNEFLQEETVFYYEKEFEQFLKKLNVRKEDIEWGSVGYPSIPYISVILYPDAPFHQRISKSQQDIVNEELWRDPNVQTRNIPAEFICFPLKENLGFEVKKIEHWQMNKNKKNKLLKIEYRFFKPGISREDFIQDENNEKIDEAINILKENKLIQPLFFAQEERYIISDPELRDLAGIIIKAFESFYNTLLIKMTYFDDLTDRESSIMNEYLGQAKFKRIKVEKELIRHKHKKKMKECSNLNEYYKILVQDDIENGTNLSVITDVEDFLYTKNYIPKVREKNKSTEEFENDRKKLYKQLLESNPKKERKMLVEEYYNYIKEKLYKQLKWLPVNFEGEGLEEIKMDYENVIKKYSFLKEIVDPIFPMIFEPPNIELQKDILYGKALGMYIDPKRNKSLDKIYEIEKIGNLEYEYEEISDIEERHDDEKPCSPIPDFEIVHIKQQRRKVSFRILHVKDLDTEERKEIKIYRNFTVRPF